MRESSTNYSLLVIIGIVVIVAVVLLLKSGAGPVAVPANVGGKAGEQCPGDVIACNLLATGKAESREVIATGGPIRMIDPSWYIWSDGYIGTNSFLLVGPNMDQTETAPGVIKAGGKVIAKEFSSRGGPITMNAGGWYIWSDGWIGAAGDFRSDKYKGTGNAFACINSEGVLYRSPKPCNK